MKIYTKQGDKGKTSLFGGSKINKDNERVEAYGTVDELNAHIGLLIAKIPDDYRPLILFQIQHILFNIGSHLANDSASFKSPEIKDSYVQDLEVQIDNMQASLPELKNFILPGGNELASISHICRTVCRRAERRVVSLQDTIELEPAIVIYLNRLSDYLFVLARFLCYQEGSDEIFWDANFV